MECHAVNRNAVDAAGYASAVDHDEIHRRLLAGLQALFDGGMTYAEIARRLHIKQPSTVSNWLLKYNGIPVGRWAAVGKLLGWAVDFKLTALDVQKDDGLAALIEPLTATERKELAALVTSVGESARKDPLMLDIAVRGLRLQPHQAALVARIVGLEPKKLGAVSGK